MIERTGTETEGTEIETGGTETVAIEETEIAEIEIVEEKETGVKETIGENVTETAAAATGGTVTETVTEIGIETEKEIGSPVDQVKVTENAVARSHLATLTIPTTTTKRASKIVFGRWLTANLAMTNVMRQTCKRPTTMEPRLWAIDRRRGTTPHPQPWKLFQKARVVLHQVRVVIAAGRSYHLHDFLHHIWLHTSELDPGWTVPDPVRSDQGLMVWAHRRLIARPSMDRECRLMVVLLCLMVDLVSTVHLSVGCRSTR